MLFGALFTVVGRSYRKINSALKSHAAGRDYKLTAQRQRGVVRAIAFKEFRRLTGSTTYMVNACVGLILSALLGIGTLAIGFDRIIAMVTQGAPISAAMLRPAIPFIVYFCIGMMSTTACSPSPMLFSQACCASSSCCCTLRHLSRRSAACSKF